jgi:hypothetical protein
MSPSAHHPIEPEGIYRPATYAMGMVAAGCTLYVAGQVARDASGALVGPNDAAVQARQDYANLGAVLAAAGTGPEHVVKVTRPTWSTRATALRPPRPGSPSSAPTGRLTPAWSWPRSADPRCASRSR